MQLNSVKSVCSSLMDKAKADHFLEHPVEDIEHEANKFVEEFAEENGLKAHTLSAFRWYFQSENRLLEDGFVELRCKTDFLKHKGSCTFELVDIAEIDDIKKSAETII